MADFGGPGSGYGSAQDTFDSAAGRGGSRTGPGGGQGPSRSDTGTSSDDVYQSFVQSSQPRGLTAIERAVQNTVQKTKDFLSQPVNRRGIIGSIIGAALLGPFGALVGGAFGRTKGGAIQSSITDFFGGGKSPYGDNIPFTNPRFEKQFTMPMDKPNIPFLTEGGVTNIDIPNFDPDMDLYAKVVGPALTQMRTLEKAKELERFGGRPLTETEQKTLDKLKEMDADPNRIYSLPVVV